MEEAVRGFLKASGLDRKLEEMPVLAAWDEAVGARVASRARAVRFLRGELLVHVDSAAYLHELTGFTGEEYRRLANRRLGQERIRRVVFKIQP